MITPRKSSFTQLERYGTRSEERFRQKFDWLSYNLCLSKKIFKEEDRKTIAIDPG